jgi:hypothetical protein
MPKKNSKHKEPKDNEPAKNEEPILSDPLEQFLEQLSGLLETVKYSKKLPMREVPKEIMDKLALLEQQADFLAKINESMFADAGIKKEQLDQDPSKNTDIPAHMRTLLKRSQQLRQEVAILEGETAAEAIIAKRYEQLKAKQEKPGNKRKSKFRRMGGTDWKPL